MINLMRIIKLGALLGLSLAASSVYALTPGNASLTNSAKLTYVGNATGILASVTVTVDTIAAVPAGVDLLDVSKSENQPFSAPFSLTASNNGPDTYAISAAFAIVLGALDALDPDPVFAFSELANGAGGAITNVALGATAMQEASTSNTIKVPSDGTNNSIVNGLEALDKVIISSITYTIDSVDESDQAFALIVLNSASTLPSLAFGTAVLEIKEFFLFSLDVGSRDNPLADTTYTITTTVTPGLDAGLATAIDVFLVSIIPVDVTKYVRNVTDDVFTGTCNDSVTISTFTYHEAGGACIVNAKPGEVLEYLIRVETPAGIADLVSAIIEDVLPPFTSYQAGTTTLDTVGVTDAGSSPVFPLDTANGGLDVGTVTASSTVDVVYQVILQ
jgi:hypothetical protein